MTISLAAIAFAKISVGATEIRKASIGDTMLWSAGVSVSDNFNRASLGSNWATRGITTADVVPILASNRFRAGVPSGYITASQMAAVYTAMPAITDNHAVRTTIASAVTGYSAGLIVRSSADMQNLVLARIVTDSAEYGIWSMAGGGELTRRSSQNTSGFSVGDVAEFRVSGNLYQLIRNPATTATVVATWNDTGSAYPASSARRYGGLWAESYKDFSSTTSNSADLDDFGFRDL